MKKFTKAELETLELCAKALPDLPERNLDGSIRTVVRTIFGSEAINNYNKLKKGGLDLPPKNEIKPYEKYRFAVPKLRDKMTYLKNAQQCDVLQDAMAKWDQEYREYVEYLNNWVAQRANKEVSDPV